MPRNMVPELQASEIFPPSSWASMRRWPSMRVTGSTTRRAMSCFLSCFRRGGSAAGFGAGLIILMRPCAVTPATTAPIRPRPEFARRDFDAETGHVRQPVVERRHVVPEARRGAADAAVAGADRPTGVIVPLHDRDS